MSVCLSEPGAEAAEDGEAAADDNAVIVEPEDDHLSSVVRRPFSFTDMILCHGILFSHSLSFPRPVL